VDGKFPGDISRGWRRRVETSKAVTYTREEIEEAIESLAGDGLIVDSGRRRFNQRTGRYDVVWIAAMSVIRDKAGILTISITALLSSSGRSRSIQISRGHYIRAAGPKLCWATLRPRSNT